jgi:hypothetical protein
MKMPYNMIAVVTTPVHDVAEEEFQLRKIRETLGPDYTVLAGVEASDASAA